jgi:hypothetical protein
VLAKIAGALLVLLLLTVESSLQTSVIWDRSTAWTPWLYKVGPLSVADIIIVVVALYTLGTVAAHRRLPRSPYNWLCLLALVYLYLGWAYNVFVFTFWKTYLYDVKVVLYLAIPFFFITATAPDSVRRWFTAERIFVCSALAALIDFAVVNISGQIEYPSILGYTALPQLFPFEVLLVGLIYAGRLSQKTLFAVLLIIETLNAINRLSAGALFNAASTAVFITALAISARPQLRVALVTAGVLSVNLLAALLLTQPSGFGLIEQKELGILTRKAELANVADNFFDNIPGVLGKGLGSTWFERSLVPAEDIYAGGTSLGATPDEASDLPVRFIFHSTPASLLYKWGLLGGLLLCGLIALYFEHYAARARALIASAGDNSAGARFSYAVLILSTIFVIENFTYIGLLKQSLITALLAANVHNLLRDASEPEPGR